MYLQHPLERQLDDRTKSQLRNDILGSGHCGENYFSFYHEQCIEALADQGRYCSARCHQDVVDIVKLLKFDTRESILATLQERYADRERGVTDRELSQTIDLAARVSTMHRIGKWQATAAGGNQLDWESGYLHDCILQYHSPQLHDAVQFESIFDIVGLRRVAGFRIIWTDNLADHLTMIDRGLSQDVRVFHHASFLLAQKDKIWFPIGFVDESIRTLSLLFPHQNRRVRRHLRRERVDPAVFACGRLKIAQRQSTDFHYFRDRLILLKQAFDHAEPSTLGQWWYDRRKRVQWSTFWVAVLVLALTVFFGLVQSIEGALQVYKAYNPTPSP